MFPIDSLPASYYEEREAAEAVRRLDKMRHPPTKPHAAAAPGQRAQRPSLSCLPPPALSRAASTTVLGNIYQGFVKTASPGKYPSSGTTTPVHTPPARLTTQAEIEATMMMAEKKKDADIVGFRAW